MSYSHYWRRAPKHNRAAFTKALEDIRRIIEVVKERGVQLAGPTGHGVPEMSDVTIAFNGSANCGHRYLDLGEPWPSTTAEGVESTVDPVVGPWFSGALLETRVCGGSCAGEAFVIDRDFLVRNWDQLEHGGYFQKCVTAFKPYDLAVTAALIRLKERLGNEIHLSSDGFERGFEDAKKLCRELFGWSKAFQLEPQESEII